MGLLAPIVGTTGLLVPYEKSVNLYDCAQLNNAESAYIDFSGGKNSLGMVSNAPTNYAQAVSGNVAMVCLANGSTMIILTKSVSSCITSMLEDFISIPSSLSDNNMDIG
jgi:hypothetical protein